MFEPDQPSENNGNNLYQRQMYFHLYDASQNWNSKLYHKQHYFPALVHILEIHTIKIVSK